MRRRLSPIYVVWRKPEYRAFMLILLLVGTGISSTLPLITLYLLDQLHTPVTLVSVFFVGQSIAGLVIGITAGRRSDRWRSRIPAMRFAAVWATVGWIIFAVSPFFWVDVLTGIVFLSASAIVMGQTFGALHDVMTRDRETHPELVNATVRAAFSMGFTLGPVLGAEIAAAVSFHFAFVVAGALSLSCLIPLWGLKVPVMAPEAQSNGEDAPSQSNRLLYVFVGLSTLVLIGAALRITYLPLDVTKHLGGSLRQYGTVLAVSPLAELFTLPAAGFLALRFRIGNLLIVGVAISVVEYAILAFNSAIWQVYLTQALDSLVVAAIFGLGLSYAQNLSPGRAGLASSAFGSAFGIATLIGNSIGAVSIRLLGIPHLFLIPLVTCAIALAVLLWLDAHTRKAASHVVLETASRR